MKFSCFMGGFFSPSEWFLMLINSGFEIGLYMYIYKYTKVYYNSLT